MFIFDVKLNLTPSPKCTTKLQRILFYKLQKDDKQSSIQENNNFYIEASHRFSFDEHSHIAKLTSENLELILKLITYQTLTKLIHSH